MNLEHLILARDSSIDFEKNTVSIFDMIEELVIRSTEPSFSFPLQMLLILRRTIEVGGIKTKLTIAITAPGGETVSNTEINLVMAPEHKRTRVRMNVALPITTSGDYVIRVAAPGLKVESSLTVTFHRDEPPEPVAVN